MGVCVCVGVCVHLCEGVLHVCVREVCVCVSVGEVCVCGGVCGCGCLSVDVEV